MQRTVFLTAAEIQARVLSLAAEITADAAGQPLTAVCILKGASVFAADLLRALPPDTELEFDRASSYSGTTSTGTVHLTYPTPVLTGKHVLIVEDIIDTGRTMHALLAAYRTQQPASLRLCTLLDKPARRVLPLEADYVGFSIPDRFVMGYGLDYDQQFRGLPDIAELVL